MACIAPLLAAQTFKGEVLKMTMGGDSGEEWPYADAVKLAFSLGHNMRVNKTVRDVVFDPDNFIVTTPAYMQGDARPHEVWEGMQKFVITISQMVK